MSLKTVYIQLTDGEHFDFPVEEEASARKRVEKFFKQGYFEKDGRYYQMDRVRDCRIETEDERKHRLSSEGKNPLKNFPPAG